MPGECSGFQVFGQSCLKAIPEAIPKDVTESKESPGHCGWANRTDQLIPLPTSHPYKKAPDKQLNGTLLPGSPPVIQEHVTLKFSVIKYLFLKLKKSFNNTALFSHTQIQLQLIAAVGGWRDSSVFKSTGGSVPSNLMASHSRL